MGRFTEKSASAATLSDPFMLVDSCHCGKLLQVGIVIGCMFKLFFAAKQNLAPFMLGRS